MFQRYKDPTPGLTDTPQAAHLERARVEIIPITGQLLARRLRRGHPFRHLRFGRVKIEARAALHRRAIKEGLDLYLWTNTKRQNWYLNQLKYWPARALVYAARPHADGRGDPA